MILVVLQVLVLMILEVQQVVQLLDLGGVFSLDLKRHFLTEGFYPSDLFDSRGLIDDITDFDGATATEVNAEMLVRVTQDDPIWISYLF